MLTFTITTSHGTRDVQGDFHVDEFGYWWRGADDALILHVAHGALHTVEPKTDPGHVSDRSAFARDRLKGIR